MQEFGTLRSQRWRAAQARHGGRVRGAGRGGRRAWFTLLEGQLSCYSFEDTVCNHDDTAKRRATSDDLARRRAAGGGGEELAQLNRLFFNGRFICVSDYVRM
eukprot:scaffold36642_cov50-Phaeocystis_antarctica.AAC.3